MQSQIVTIARMRRLTPNDTEPGIYMNKTVVEAFNLPDTMLGGIASFSIEGCIYRMRITAFTDDSHECIMYFSDAALRLMRVKADSNYLVTYHPLRRLFAFGYRKNIKQASYDKDTVDPSAALFDWYVSDRQMKPATFGQRALALAVDTAILLLLFAALLNWFSFMSSLVIGAIICWLYFSAMESSSLQATVGKLLFGMYVTDIYRRRIGFVTASGRFFARIVTPLALIGNVLVRGRTSMHAFHDLVTGCAVVRRR